jgi:signal transduction histidine kinase
MRSLRPLDFLGSIKLKLGAVIVAAVGVTVAVVTIGGELELPPLVTALVALALALVLVQLLAHGMTYPLREMVAAARGMARGDYSRRVTATSRDEVGELARAFNAMAAELEQVDRIRRDLVANASHELRTPIGALQARLENLVDGVEEPDHETMEGLLAQVQRLGALTEQLLDLSRLESGAVPLRVAEVGALELLERIASDWRSRTTALGVELDVDVDPPDLALRADEPRIRQVIDNLLANAVRHSPPGGAVALRAAADGDRVWLEVVDDGPGIPPGEAELVFERFYRSDQARSADEGGTGLGLAIARWIVELHRGSITVDRDWAQGCRIVVELPR